MSSVSLYFFLVASCVVCVCGAPGDAPAPPAAPVVDQAMVWAQIMALLNRQMGGAGAGLAAPAGLQGAPAAPQAPSVTPAGPPSIVPPTAPAPPTAPSGGSSTVPPAVTTSASASTETPSGTAERETITYTIDEEEDAGEEHPEDTDVRTAGNKAIFHDEDEIDQVGAGEAGRRSPAHSVSIFIIILKIEMMFTYLDTVSGARDGRPTHVECPSGRHGRKGNNFSLFVKNFLFNCCLLDPGPRKPCCCPGRAKPATIYPAEAIGRWPDIASPPIRPGRRR